MTKSSPEPSPWLEETPKTLWAPNALERTNQEAMRRTPASSLFTNEASCLRLVTAQTRTSHSGEE